MHQINLVAKPKQTKETNNKTHQKKNNPIPQPSQSMVLEKFIIWSESELSFFFFNLMVVQTERSTSAWLQIQGEIVSYSTFQLFLNGELTSKLLEHLNSYSKASQLTVLPVRNRNLILNETASEDCILIFLKPKQPLLQPFYSVLPLKIK